MTSLSLVKRAVLVGVGIVLGFNGVVVTVAPTRIPDTYGVTAEDPDLEVLLRHRAVMLAIIGLVLVASGFRRELRAVGVPAAALSMIAFVLFARSTEVNEHQQGVATIDGVLLALLALAVALPDRGHRVPAGRWRRARDQARVHSSWFTRR
ncbi:MAG TPA: hypothetical protein VD813_06690 [Pseudonocardia sp.]|nr:hypothetical protein [Pseudonocardia sp.]